MPEHRYPGVGRVAYMLLTSGLYLLVVLTVMVCFLASPHLAHYLTAEWQIEAWMWGFIIGVNFLIIGVLTLAAVLRLRNLGMSGWWAAVRYVPFLNLWLLWRMLICPEGYADHKQLDLPGKIIAVILLIVFGLPLVAWLFDAAAKVLSG